MRKRFIIPANFMESGYVMNGAVPIRNLVEGIILGLIGFGICKLLPLPTGTDAITPYILIIAPLAMIGISGVQGDPLSIFIVDFFKWRRRRKPCFYNTHSEAYTQEAADMVMDSPQLRDMIADALEKLRGKMAAKDISYVEGETFEFASDPEQEALKEAQKELAAKREAEAAKLLEQLEAQQKEAEKEQAETVSPFVQPESATNVDAEKIAQMMVLDELDWEEDQAHGPEEEA